MHDSFLSETPGSLVSLAMSQRGRYYSPLIKIVFHGTDVWRQNPGALLSEGFGVMTLSLLREEG